MKKNSAGDLMNNPFYSRIMFEIESLVHKRDEEALEQGLRLTDSNVKSAIRKTMGMFEGKPVASTPDDERKQWIGRMAIELAGLAESFEKRDVARKDYSRALLAVEDSLKTRREFEGHSRGYLDFLKRFVEQHRID